MNEFCAGLVVNHKKKKTLHLVFSLSSVCISLFIFMHCTCAKSFQLFTVFPDFFPLRFSGGVGVCALLLLHL